MFTTIDYTHPDPRYRSREAVSVHLQHPAEELVAGATIEVGKVHPRPGGG